MSSRPPRIFSDKRRMARRLRVLGRDDGPRFIIDSMIEEVADRLGFMRLEPAKPLVVGDHTGQLGRQLAPDSCTLADIVGSTDHMEIDLEKPYPLDGYDFIANLGLLDTVNDLPGALLHMRNALAPGGVAIACFVGGGSLTKLRRAMLEADGNRPAARVHPLIDPRSCPQLLSRAGWAHPVVDSYLLSARYPSMDRLVQDLRDMAMGNVLASAAPPVTRDGLSRAREAFMAMADDDGKVTETFEIITLTGRRSLAGT